MISKGFSNGEAFKFGWHAWKKNWVSLLRITLFYLFLPLLPIIILQFLPEDATVLGMLLQVIHFVLMVIAVMGFVTISLKIAREEEFSLGDFFTNIHLFPSFLLAYILYYLGTLVGFVLLLIPGVYFSVKYNFWPFFILDRAFKGLESLKASGQITYGAKWDLLLFFIGLLLVNLLGLLCFIVGLFVTIPLTTIAWAYIYEKLTRTIPVEGPTL